MTRQFSTSRLSPRERMRWHAMDRILFEMTSLRVVRDVAAPATGTQASSAVGETPAGSLARR